MVSPVKTLVPYTIIRFASGRASGCKITLQLPYDSQMSDSNKLHNGTRSNNDNGVVSGREKVRCGPIQTVIQRPHKLCKLRLSSLNVGTMRGRANEVVETLGRRNIDICCIQESRWKGCSVRLIKAKDFTYKFIWSGDSSGFGGVGILIEKKWIDKIISVVRVDHQIIHIRILIGKLIINIFRVYAPQTGLSTEEKDSFYTNLLTHVSAVPSTEYLMLCGDFNGHVGRDTESFDRIHGGHGFGSRNTDGVRILDFCTATNLAITNTFFVKPNSHLITYHSGCHFTQVDYILTKRCDLKYAQNVKVIGDEECVTQHKLLVCDLHLKTRLPSQHKPQPKRRIWKLRNSEIQEKYKMTVEEAIHSSSNLQSSATSVESMWNDISNCLTVACDKICGWTKGCSNQRETWWWDENVSNLIKNKRKLWKEWQKGGSKELYLAAKRKAKSGVYLAKKVAQEQKFRDLNKTNGKNFIFKLAKRMKSENQDIVGDKCVTDDNGNLSYDDASKLKAWKSHYEKLLNVEFPWESDSLPQVEPISGPPIYITEEMVLNSIKKMKSGKAAGPSGIVIEMIRSAGEGIISSITQLANCIIYENKIPEDWNLSFIVSFYKGKGYEDYRKSY